MQATRSGQRRPVANLALLTVGLVLHLVWLEGCVSYHPKELHEVPFRERAETVTLEEVRVTAAALGRAESKELFGVPLAKHGIQPLWLEIENGGEQSQLFFQQTIDSQYWAPAEAAYRNHFSATKRFLSYGLIGLILWPLLLVAPVQWVAARRANRRMDALFVERGIGNRIIEPGDKAEGFVFTHLDEGTKPVTVGLLGPAGPKEVSLFVQVPGLRVDHERLDPEKVYGADEIEEVDQTQLLERLVGMPCCTTNEEASGEGDPVNLVVIGEPEAMIEAFVRAGWDETEVLSMGTSLKTARSFLFSSEYRNSPVSNLYLFGRAQDVAFQKARDTIHERNHLRLWLAPMRFEGAPVWVGQISRDIGVKFTTRAWNLTTHAIDGDVDDSRENIVGDLLFTGRVARIGYVPGVGSTEELEEKELPENLMGDAYFTDGKRAVAQLVRESVEAGLFDWTVWAVPAPMDDQSN